MTPHQQTVSFYTLGCKLNFSETSTLGRYFKGAGYEMVDFPGPADIYVVNTCSVTDMADQKCRNIVRKAIRKNPNARVIVVGCYAQLKPAEIAEIPGVDMVLGAADKFRIMEYLQELETAQEPLVYASDVNDADFFVEAYSIGDRTRTFLKVQDGCDYKCTFCTIPKARGASRSDSIDNVIKQALELAHSGVKEIVLTGVNIGDFGKQPGESISAEKENFLDLIKELDQLEGIERFRISSIEPNLLNDEIIEFVASSNRFVPHFHIPLQSGSDEILKLMRRRYRSDLYRDRVAHIRKVMPDACIGVDVIVGFPGETDEHFRETVNFLKDLEVSYFHVFTYSERANTLAIDMPGAVPMQIRKERNAILRSLSSRKLRAFYEQHIGETRPVLWESNEDNGMMSGFTDNYIKVTHEFDPELVNRVLSESLKAINNESLSVEVTSKNRETSLTNI